MFMKRSISVLLLIFVLAGIGLAQSVFTTNDLLNVKRVGDPQLSPDGRVVAFTVGTVNKPENRVVTHIYTVNLDGTGLDRKSVV